MSLRFGASIGIGLTAAVFASSFTPARAQEPSEAPAALESRIASLEKELCFRNLHTIYDAIQKYRADRKELPDWLSDLVPQYLKSTEVLLCPVTKRTGERDTYGIEDPKVQTSYIYEFCAQPMPDRIWGGAAITMRQFKSLQMAVVGGRTPILRCHQHAETLNVGFDGEGYESGVTWEAQFQDVVSLEALSPQGLLQRFALAPRGMEPMVTVRPARPAIQPTAPGQPSVQAEPSGPGSLVGKPAPAFALETLSGDEFELAALRGEKLVLLDFWATWCPPCRQAMPVLDAVAADYGERGVVYAAVNLREEPAKVRAYLEANDLDLIVPLDRDGSVAKRFLVSGIPTMVVLDKAGVVRHVRVGFSSSLDTDLRSVLDGLLDRPAASVP